MALSYAQIVALSCQVAKCPNFTSQAGQLLNAILRDLCQNYDLDLAKKFLAFNFATAGGGPRNVPAGAGPNYLPADFLRTAKDDVVYTINGVPYPMTPVDNAEYDWFVQNSGLQSYPTFYSVFFDQVQSGGVPYMQVWVPAAGAYPVTMNYYCMMPQVATPETDASIPWFPAQSYLRTRLQGELCLLTGDDRAEGFLTDDERQNPMGAGVLLRKYLLMKDDAANRPKTVSRDRRRFGASFNTLPNTKVVGW